jgi:hypothetical protein
MSRVQSDLKKVRVRFTGVSNAEEGLIRKFINQTLLQRPTAITPYDPGVQVYHPRNDVRLDLRDIQVKLYAKETKSLKAREITCHLVDLSCGGMCVSVPRDMPLAIGGEVLVFLPFIAAEMTVNGVILGLKGRSAIADAGEGSGHSQAS